MGLRQATLPQGFLPLGSPSAVTTNPHSHNTGRATSSFTSQPACKGLNIRAEAIFGKNTVPVTGSILPPDPKNANISMTLSHTLLKTIITYAAKISSVKADNLEASITKITYTFQPDSTIQASYWTDIRKDEESYATGKTTLIISHECKISKDKMTVNIKLVRSDHSVNPPEASDEVQDLLSGVLKKLLSAAIGMWNLEESVLQKRSLGVGHPCRVVLTEHKAIPSPPW
ncbi:hypothetical protein GHT09_016438 [Marmota monax]|uniref:Vomeromodulin-like n=1 Tax=Marmota monax TaxID=9995 RepID=A0A834Q7M2_MARMO|nr:hypothetical protein GHT09_016438 [Marmota monax]